MNSICVYTCITNNYDKLMDPEIYSRNIDYICFTDNLHIKSKFWKIMPIPYDLRYLSLVKQQRILKICPHRYLPEYNTSVWIDGNIKICRNINDFIMQYDLNKIPLYVRIHPGRNCIYKEALVIVEKEKENADVVQKQITKYKNDGYPENAGLAETGILLRQHNNKKCILLDNAWAEEILKHSHRDQLSFNYICWKQKFIPGYLTNIFHINNEFFKLIPHCK